MIDIDLKRTPRSLGYYFPPEWHPHKGTWLSWPHKEASWPGKLDRIFPVMASFVKALGISEQVYLNVNNDAMMRDAEAWIDKAGADLSKVTFFVQPTNDAWCRDYGPAFLLNRDASVIDPKVIVDWGYNAWGGKYPPFDLDDAIPSRIARRLNYPLFNPSAVMEGGSVDFNGKGTVITTTSCLLNANRNPQLTQDEIELYLYEFYGVEQILWLGDGIKGDDTDGHVDDLTRFVSEDTVITMVERDKNDDNFVPLRDNLTRLKEMRLLNGKPLNIVEIEMPSAQRHEGVRLPASYANFYIANGCVIVPVFNVRQDELALRALSALFPSRSIIGIVATDLIWGLGSFHCLSQQEPSV